MTSSTSTSIDPAAPGRPPLHERWLRDPRRRLVLVFGIVLGIAGLSTGLWLDFASERGADAADAWAFFGRQVLSWGAWLVWVEPLARLARWSVTRLRNPLLLVAFHAAVALAFATGITAVKLEYRDTFFPRPPWASIERERSGEPELNATPSAAAVTAQPGPATPSSGTEPDARPERRSRGRRGRSGWRSEDRLRTASTSLGLGIYGAILALAAGVGAFLKQRDEERRTLGLELRAAELESELARAELANLSRQVHPHFLFNALHAITALVESGEREVAVTALADLGELLRRALAGGEEQTVPLGAELELVERYLDLERLRLGDRLRVRIETEPGTAGVRVPTLSVLSLVENAVKHAIAPREEGGEISMVVRRQDGKLRVVVEDDGPGFRHVQPGGLVDDPGAHIGLDNTRRRLAALHGGRAGLTLANRTDGGARVILWILDEEGGA